MEDKGTLWLPEAASTMAPEIDKLFYFVYYVSIVIFVAVVAYMVYFVIKYRRKHEDEMPGHVHESIWMETSLMVIPTILCLVVFTWGFQSFIKMNVAPPESYEIQARGMKWSWQFEYDTGAITTNELHVPVGRPVKMVMTSSDVLHSFFVPAFRVKHDVVPNRYTSVWFNATKEGEFNLFCTEYCGTQHSGMLAKVFVHSEEDFQEWLQSAGGSYDDMPLPEYGEVLYQQQACFSCHSLDGSAVVGPSFQGLFGSQRVFDDGTTATADENYLLQSIQNPGSQLVEGYQNVMPANYGELDQRQYDALIAFIKEQQ